MKTIFLLLGIILSLIASAQIKFQEMPFEKAMNKATELKKDILVDVISGRVDDKSISKILADKELANQIEQDFIIVRIDMMKKENASFVPKVLGTPYPCVMLFTNKGEEVGSGFWDEMAAGRMNAGEIFSKAKANAEIKRQNSCKIEFRDLSFPDALKMAKEENRLIFVDCVMKNCSPCRKMESDIFSLDMIANFYNKNFICIRSERETDEYDLVTKYDLRGYPTFLFIDGDAKVVASESGFLAAEKFLDLGKKTLGVDDNEQNEVKSVPMLESTEAIPASSGSSSAAQSSIPMEANTMPANNEELSNIKFEKLTLTQAQAKAKAEKKLIYVDLSATWCGPCQQLKKTTFPNEMVSNFMNKNFINIAFECDKDGEMSMEYRNKYKSTAFPTHLIIDETGELVHKFVGFHQPNEFIAELQKGTGAAKGLQYYNRKYIDGERSPEFMQEYITVLANANERGAAAKLAADYLNTLSTEQLSTPENFALVYEFCRDIDSQVAQRIMSNSDMFVKAVGESNFDNYVFMLWSIKADSHIQEVDGKNSFDRKGYEETIRKMKATKFKGADNIALSSKVRNTTRMGDWKNFLDITIGYMEKNGAQANPMLTCNWGIDLKNGCHDKSVWKTYGNAMVKNFEKIKKSGKEEDIMWEESIRILSEELLK